MSGISAEEFNRVQSQALAEKSARYEAEGREKKISADYAKLKAGYVRLEQECKKIQALFDKSKDRNGLLKMQQEYDNLKKEFHSQNNDHIEQSNALRMNIQKIYKDLDEVKGEKDRLDVRVIDLKKKDVENQILLQKMGEKVGHLEKLVQYMEQQIQQHQSLDMDTLLISLKQDNTALREQLNGDSQHVSVADSTVVEKDMKQQTSPDKAVKPVEMAEDSAEQSTSAEAEQSASDIVTNSAVENDKSTLDATAPVEQSQSVDAHSTHSEITPANAAITLVNKLQISDVMLTAIQQLWSSKLAELTHQINEARTVVTLSPQEQQEEKRLKELPSKGVAQNERQTQSQSDQDLLTAITKLEKQLQDTKNAYTEEKDTLQQQLIMWQEKLKIKQKNLLEVEEKMKELQEQYTQTNNQKETQIAKLKENYGNMEQFTKQKEADLVKANTTITKLNAEIDSIVKRVTATQQDRDQQMRQAEEQVLRGKQLQLQIDNLNKKSTELVQQKAKVQQDLTELQTKVKNDEPIMDKGRRFDALHTQYEAELEKTKKNLIEITNQQSHQAELRKQIEMVQEKNKKMGSSTIQLQDQIHTLTQQNESAVKEREQIIVKCKEYISEMSQREQMLKLSVDQLNDKHVKLNECIASQDENIIKWFTSCTLVSAQYNIEKKEFNQMRNKFTKVQAQFTAQQTKVAHLTTENESLSQAVNTVKVDYQLQLRKSSQLIKELRAQLASKPPTPTAPVLDGRQHRRSGSSSSIGSTEFQSPMKSPVPALNVSPVTNVQPIPNISLTVPASVDQVQRDNQLLLGKISELQTSRWKLDERVRMLEENVMLLHEDIEKKTEIINYYVQRERMGRLSSESEQNRADIAKKKEVKALPIEQKFTKEVFDRMQQVMEETLLHNIQLQKDIKTLGDEVARLLEGNRNLKKQVDELSISKLASHNQGVGSSEDKQLGESLSNYQRVLLQTQPLEGPKRDPTLAANALLHTFSKITASSSYNSFTADVSSSGNGETSARSSPVSNNSASNKGNNAASPDIQRIASSPVLKPKPKTVKKKTQDAVPKSLYRREF